MRNLESYTKGDRFQILIPSSEVSGVVDDWASRNIACDLRLRRAKTHGFVVVELEDVIYARNIIIWHPDSRVNIVKAKNIH